jgi:hypothetical protein
MLRLLALGAIGYAAYKYIQSKPELKKTLQDKAKEYQNKATDFVKDLGLNKDVQPQ